MLENVDLLRQAVEVEIKYSYIDIQGKTFKRIQKNKSPKMASFD